jgi:hypothetical protein
MHKALAHIEYGEKPLKDLGVTKTQSHNWQKQSTTQGLSARPWPGVGASGKRGLSAGFGGFGKSANFAKILHRIVHSLARHTTPVQRFHGCFFLERCLTSAGPNEIGADVDNAHSTNLYLRTEFFWAETWRSDFDATENLSRYGVGGGVVSPGGRIRPDHP